MTSVPVRGSEPHAGEPRSGETHAGEPRSGEPRSGEPRSRSGARARSAGRALSGGRPRGPGGRPRGSTRERILDVALDLFTEHGYDKTSLREIAEALGFTKAALYYHFERKEDILLALHLRMHALGHGVLEQLDQFGTVGKAGAMDDELGAWRDMLDTFIDRVLENRKLFLFHARNQNALEQIQHDEHNAAEHEDMEEQLRSALGNPAIPAATRIRMACSIGAVFGGLMGAAFGGPLSAAGAFARIPDDELAAEVRAAVQDLLGPPTGDTGRRGARRAAPSRRAAAGPGGRMRER